MRLRETRARPVSCKHLLVDARLWALLSVCLAIPLVVAHLLLHRKAQGIQPFLPGQSINPIVGLSRQGTLVDLARSSSPCRLVRYESATCEASKVDRAQLVKLAGVATARGCEVVTLAPSPELNMPDSLGLEVALVTPRSLEASPLRFTPTTLLVDREWRVLWSRIGSLSFPDVVAAERAVPSRR